MLTFEQIKELIEIVTEQRLQRLEVERAGFRLRIDGRDRPARSTTVPVSQAGAGAAAETAPAGDNEAGAEEPAAEAANSGEAAAPAAAEDGLHVLNSPIVGTFYEAPGPDSDPYVTVGDRVKRGQVLCIVEAMKLMNEIESDVDGVLEEIYPKNAEPVEFGEPLFAIRPD